MRSSGGNSSAVQVREPKQRQLEFPNLQENVGGIANIVECFRGLYYHLYSNSRASRAERIIEDLSMLLLLKLASDRGKIGDALSHFLRTGGEPNQTLLPALRRAFPEEVDDHNRFAIETKSLQEALRLLSSIDLSSAPAHVLGEAFQALIGPRMRGDKGQFFTPVSLVRAMVEILDPQPHETVLDPACGTGGFLVEAQAHRVRRGSRGGEQPAPLIGMEKDHGLARLASALLAITGSGKVVCTDSLRALAKEQIPTLAGCGQFDVVLTNPPFGSRIAIKDGETLRAYDLAMRWKEEQGRWGKLPIALGSQDPQILFVELCVRALRPGGRLGIVLPEGLFGNKKTAFVWDWLRDMGTITAILDCPRTTFQPGTDTKTNVLFFERSANGSPPSRKHTRVATALQCGHDRRGRTHAADGRPYPDDFADLARSFARRNGSWSKADLTRTYYLVPRYHADQAAISDEESAIIQGAKVVSLRELKDAGELSIRKGHEVGSEAYGTGPIPFVRTSDISNFEIRSDPTNGVSEEVYETYAGQQHLRPGDILLVVDGRYRIGAPAILTEANCRCIVQSHLRIISLGDESDIDPYALLFALSLSHVRMRIRNLVFIQSTLGTVGSRLLELRIPLFTGDGPWTDSLERFRRALVQRDKALRELHRLAGREWEL